MSTKKYTTQLDLILTAQAAALNNLQTGADEFTIAANKVTAFKAAQHSDADWNTWNRFHDGSLNNYKTLSTLKSAAGQLAFNADQLAAKAAATAATEAAKAPVAPSAATPAPTPATPAPAVASAAATAPTATEAK